MKYEKTIKEHVADILAEVQAQKDQKEKVPPEKKKAPVSQAGATQNSSLCTHNIPEKKTKFKFSDNGEGKFTTKIKDPGCETTTVSTYSFRHEDRKEKLLSNTMNRTFKFPVAINTSVKGLGKPDFGDKEVASALTYDFEEKSWTVLELADGMKRGFHITSHCVDDDGCFHRAAKYFKSTHFIGLDFDNTDPKQYQSIQDALDDPLAQQSGCILYETKSSTTEHNKFRILICLTEPITNSEVFIKAVKRLIKLFGSDHACADPSRVFLGAKEGGRVEIIGTAISLESLEFILDDEEEMSALIPLSDENTGSKANRYKKFTEKAIANAVKLLDASSPGNRHATRCRISFRLGTLKGAGLFPNDEYIEPIRDAVERNTDDLDKSLATIYSGIEAGMKNPIDLRKYTSSANGKKGGRKSLPILGFVKDFREETSSNPLVFFRGEFYRFNGQYYSAISQSDAEARVVAFLQKETEDDERVSVHVKNDFFLNLKAQGMAYIPSDRQVPCYQSSGKPAGNILSMKNGLLDLDKFRAGAPYMDYFFPHSPDLFITSGCPFDYNPSADCPRWAKFVSEVQPTEEGQEFLQLVFALSFLASCKFEVVIYFYGPAGTGKSVTLYILEHLHGKDAVCCVPLSRFSERFALHLLTTHSLNLVGDLPTASEFSSMSKVEGALKDIISGSLVDCEKKGQDLYTARAKALNVFASNSLAVFTDRSRGIWDRLRIVPFMKVFRGTDKQNNHLKEDLVQSELPGVFNWTLQGLSKLDALNYFPEHPEGEKIKEDHSLACDHERRFLEDHTEAKTGGSVLCSGLYKGFSNWIDDNGYRGCGEARFGDSVKRVYPEAFKYRKANGLGKRLWYWINIVQKT